MSSSYFVTPYDPIAWRDGEPNPKPTSDLRIDFHDFAQKLAGRWPGIKVHLGGGESNVALAWEFPLPPQIARNYGGTTGILFDDLQLVSLSRDYDGKFQGFLTWYRTY